MLIEVYLDSIFVDFLVEFEEEGSEIAFEDGFEVVPGKADAVVGHTVLGEVVGADLLGT